MHKRKAIIIYIRLSLNTLLCSYEDNTRNSRKEAKRAALSKRMCVAAEMLLLNVVAKAFLEKNDENPHCRFFMDAAGVTRQCNCNEKADDGKWMTRIDEGRFHLQHDHFQHLGEIARHCIVVTSDAITQAIRAVIYRSTIVQVFSF